jgi:hypothetical protein
VLLLKGKKERKRIGSVIEKRVKTTTLDGEKEGRRERTTSLPPPLERAAQRWWKNITKEVEGCRKKGSSLMTYEVEVTSSNPPFPYSCVDMPKKKKKVFFLLCLGR